MTQRLGIIALALGLCGCRGLGDAAHEAPPDRAAAPAAEPTTTLTVGAKAPDFALTSSDGTTVALADLVATGPTIVTFYRGDW